MYGANIREYTFGEIENSSMRISIGFHLTTQLHDDAPTQLLFNSLNLFAQIRQIIRRKENFISWMELGKKYKKTFKHI